MTYSFEPITISETVKNEFQNKISQYFGSNALKNYQLIITGPIASGKSTLLQHVIELFKINSVPYCPILEYIDYDIKIGTEMLHRYINKEISNSTFQNYILDCYDIQLKHHKNDGPKLYERPIDDSIMCFANIANYNDADLTDFDLMALYIKSQNINAKYNVPSYTTINPKQQIPIGSVVKEIEDVQLPVIRNDSTKFIELVSNSIEESLMIIIDIIHDDLENQTTKRIIGLNVSLSTCKYRIQKRGRECESNYSDEYLDSIINYYQKIYKLIKDKKTVRFTNFGQLIC